ncbi:MAG: hypothetical protein PUK62_00010 [Prevotellaceae bacterium]|nr:hypothetical protein [Prevotellaceae bacterium]
MKKIVFILFTIILCGCAKDEIQTKDKFNTDFSSRSGGDSFSTVNDCFLNNGQKVICPWGIGSKTIIPDEVRLDIKEQDGWRILYTTVDFKKENIKVSKADVGTNYILLYNIYSGVLKGFCYLSNVVSNNNAFWVLDISTPTKLFNFAGYFAEGINSPKSPQRIVLSPITKTIETRGFEQGWNCFQIELAYDPNSQNQLLGISAYALNKATYEFKGEYDSKSTGSIVSTSSVLNSTVSGVANKAGEGAKDWFMNNVVNKDSTNKEKNKFWKELMGDGAQYLVSTFIKEGAQLLFGSFLGEQRTNFSATLSFNTHGKVIVKGESTTPASGMVPPVAGIPLNALGQNLGVWNLETPKCTPRAAAPLSKVLPATNAMTLIYKMSFTPNISLQVNPAMKKFVSFKGFNIVNYELYNGMESNLYKDESAYRSPNYIPKGKVLYEEKGEVKITTQSNPYDVHMKDTYPNRTIDSETPALAFGEIGVNPRRNLVLKALVEVKTPNGSTIYSSKSFIADQAYPYYSEGRPGYWTLEQLKKYGWY